MAIESSVQSDLSAQQFSQIEGVVATLNSMSATQDPVSEVLSNNSKSILTQFAQSADTKSFRELVHPTEKAEVKKDKKVTLK